MIKLAVVGNPIFHSLSPNVFSAFAQDLDIKYNRISSPSIKDAFNFVKDLGLSGLNVTSPFKIDVLDIIDKVDYQASNLNSANTVRFVDDLSYGFNTDYFGILMTIWDHNFIFNKQKVLILGAGAAGRTAAFAVRNLNSFVYLWDRNENKANKVSTEVGIQSITTEEITREIDSFKYIISTIPQNAEILTKITFSKNHTIFDTIYHNSYFINNKEKFGYTLITGEKWLINQAILSYEIFLGSKPTFIPLIQDLEKAKTERLSCIVLIGFSGSGKTSIGKSVAENLNAEFYDIDTIIEEKTSLTINELFEQHGEDYFRQLEHEILKNLTNQVHSTSKPIIISAGGGILTKSHNIDLIKKLGFVVWMYSPIDVSFDRIENKQNRPLVKDFNSAKELYNSRKNEYFIHSDGIFLNTNSEVNSVERLTNELQRLIQPT